MNAQLFFAFIVVAAALACTPGVDWAYSITAGLRQRSFVPAVAGLCGGYVLHTVLMVAGLAALLAGMPGVLGWITVAGRRLPPVARHQHPPLLARRLLQCGRRRREAPPPTSSGHSCRAWAPAASTPRACCSTWPWCRSSSAPKRRLPVPVQSGLLGLTFVLLAGIVYTCVALLARKLLQSRPGAARAGDAGQRYHHGGAGRGAPGRAAGPAVVAGPHPARPRNATGGAP